MADFPARRGSSAFDVSVGVASCLVILAILVAWVVALVFLIHGAATKDMWEVIYGGVMIVVLLIVRKLLS